MIWIFMALMGSVSTEPVSISVADGEIEHIDPGAGTEHLALDEVHLGTESSLVLPQIKSIHIQKIVAEDGARIRLLSLSSGASAGGDGASARIFIREVSGHLLIESRGGDGANGRDGLSGRQGAQGANGRRARTLVFGLFYLGDGEDGEAGERGENGEDGTDGGDGGRGGRVAVYYQSKAEFAKVVVDVDGGKGGRAGLPGMGGLGGNGGRGGPGIQRGRQGPLGQAGLLGKPGRSGRSGEPGSASVFQLGGALYDCLSRLDARQQLEKLEDQDFDQCRGELAQTTLSSMEIMVTEQFAPNLQRSSDEAFWMNADGKKGEDSPPARGFGARSPDAQPGTNGGRLTVVVRELPRRAIISAVGGDGGKGTNGIVGAPGIDGFDGRSGSLFQKARPGTDGSDGQSGGDGANGGDGGRGGHIRIVYIPTGEFEPNWRGVFSVEVGGGRPGEGGRGGDGGRGGRAGRGGATVVKGKSKADGHSGNPGSRGHDGKAGRQGEDGQIEFLEAKSFTDWIVDDFKSFY